MFFNASHNSSQRSFAAYLGYRFSGFAGIWAKLKSSTQTQILLPLSLKYSNLNNNSDVHHLSVEPAQFTKYLN